MAGFFGGIWDLISGTSPTGTSASMAAPREQVVCEVVPGLGYAQCPPDYRTADPVLEEMTSGTFAGALVRLIAGYEPSNRLFSRTRKSAQISRDLELGWAHAATVGKDWQGRRTIEAFAHQIPTNAAAAWGSAFAEQLKGEAFRNAVIDLFLNRTTLPDHDPRALELLQGWNGISQTVPGQRIYSAIWWASKVAPMIGRMQARGWTGKRTLAAAVRLRNSGRQAMLFGQPEGTDETVAVDTALAAYQAERASRSNDVTRLYGWPEFEGQITRWPEVNDLKIGQGGTVVPISTAGDPYTPQVPLPAPSTTTTTTTAPPPPAVTATPSSTTTVMAERPRWPIYAGVAAGFTLVVAVGLVAWDQMPKRGRRS